MIAAAMNTGSVDTRFALADAGQRKRRRIAWEV
jgi:hypothetical protein